MIKAHMEEEEEEHRRTLGDDRSEEQDTKEGNENKDIQEIDGEPQR